MASMRGKMEDGDDSAVAPPTTFEPVTVTLLNVEFNHDTVVAYNIYILLLLTTLLV